MPGILKFPTKISNKQAKDTGMAMVLILLLIGLFSGRIIYFKFAVGALVVDMIWPMAFYPFAVVWLGLSHFLGTIVSKILLTAVFFVMVVPVGLVRRMMSKDTLQLREFKKSTDTAMRIRDHVFVALDIERPY
jgi:hypothetical protein